MVKVILGVLMATTMLAATLIPSQVLTVSISERLIVISTQVPPNSKLFGTEEEVLASIATVNEDINICSLKMTTITTRNSQEKNYDTG